MPSFPKNWITCARPTLMSYDCVSGWESHRNWACRPNARHSTRAGAGRAHASRCRARAHKGPAQAQRMCSQARVTCHGRQADNRNGTVRACRCKARAHKRDMQCKHPVNGIGRVAVAVPCHDCCQWGWKRAGCIMSCRRYVDWLMTHSQRRWRHMVCPIDL